MTGFDHENERDEALRVLAPMREGPLAVAGRAQEQDALRARVLDAMRAQVSELPAVRRARTRRRVAIGVLAGSTVLAAAAAATLAFVAHESPSIASNDPRSPAGAALSVEAIDLIAGAEHNEADWLDASGQSHALATQALPTTGTLELRANGTAPRLRTSQGVELKLSPEARLRVRSADNGEGPELRLLAGAVACAVPKLGATRQFAIDAPGARVIVHGTRFSVNATSGKTCVRVTEGLVAVHPEASDAPVKRLGPGEQWGCEREAKAPAPARAATKARARPARTVDAAPEPEAGPAGTLDAENRLLAEALSAERKNDRARAQRLFAELLRSHPSSPLAVEAAAGLERTRD